MLNYLDTNKLSFEEIMTQQIKPMNKIIVPAGPTYTDSRGTIEMLIESLEISSVSRITSVAGSVRASHAHFDDYHMCLLTKGQMNYYERPIYSQERPTLALINEGDLFFTAPKMEHLMEFVTDSVFYCFSKNNRKQATYESDTVKLPFDLREIYNQMS